MTNDNDFADIRIKMNAIQDMIDNLNTLVKNVENRLTKNQKNTLDGYDTGYAHGVEYSNQFFNSLAVHLDNVKKNGADDSFIDGFVDAFNDQTMKYADGWFQEDGDEG